MDSDSQRGFIWPDGIKRTKPRERVLAVLAAAKRPLSAQEICSAMERSDPDGSGAAWISTVYRALELFVSRGVAEKLAMMNSDVALYELASFRHRHYAVCVGCKKIIPMSGCPIEECAPKVDDGGFRVLGHNLQVYGYCKDCSGSEKEMTKG